MDWGGLVEQALFFTMGFLAACLAVVVGIPAISRRAMRLSQARATLRAPTIERQAIAERDALRARSAVEHVRLERRLALTEDASNRLRVAVGKQSVKILALETAATEHMSVIVDQRAEIAERESSRRDLEVALGASQIALNDLFAQRDRANIAAAAATARKIELEAEASRNRARIAILTARGENTEGRLEDLSRSRKATAEKAETTRAQLTDALANQSRRLEGRLRDATLQNEQLSASVSSSGVSLDESRMRLAELESRLALSEQAREETLLENGRQLAALADREAALRTARATVVELESRLAAVSADGRAHESAARQSAPNPGATRGLMEGSLRAAGADREPLQREDEAFRARIAELSASAANTGDDAALRESIERLGREVNRLFAAQKSMDQREGHGPGGRLSFGRHNAGALVEASNDERHGFVDGSVPRVARSLAPDP